jgi:hypothetical protein
MNIPVNIFEISIEEVQYEAELRFKRRLNEDELSTVKKCIEYGLLTGIDIVLNAAFEEALSYE